MRLSQSDTSVVIDIEDDGAGVSLGSEELVFLRFYQDPNTQTQRKGTRGLGLGLFLARYVAEQHLGQLHFVRNRNKRGVFRFLWPIDEECIVKLQALKKKGA